MKHPAFIIAATTIVVLGTGCVLPQSGTSGSRFIQYTDPIPNGYFTGAVPDFAERQTNDALERKFKVKYLTVSFVKCADSSIAKEVVAKEGNDPFMRTYMQLRENARGYDASVRKTVMNSQISWRNYQKLILNSLWREYGLSDEDKDFIDKRDDMDYHNEELSRRYPNLFSTDKTAFPLDIVVIAAFDPSGCERTRTMYEAWLIGLPEHSDIYKNYGKKAIFPPEKGWLSPYDAIAAALFKLSVEQFEGLEPANPNDHIWLEQ